jgi:hypothetical protein
LIGTGSFFISREEQVAALALRHTVPAIYGFGSFLRPAA